MLLIAHLNEKICVQFRAARGSDNPNFIHTIVIKSDMHNKIFIFSLYLSIFVQFMLSHTFFSVYAEITTNSELVCVSILYIHENCLSQPFSKALLP